MNCYFTTGCGLLPTNKVNFSDTLMHLKSITAVFSNKNQSSTRNHPFCMHVPYSRKYWWSIKFGSLAVGEATVKCKSVKFKCDLRIYILFYACACAHIIYTELPPNLNPPIFLFQPLGTKPPNLKIANISSYTVCQHVDALLLPVRIILCMAMLLHYSILYM